MALLCGAWAPVGLASAAPRRPSPTRRGCGTPSSARASGRGPSRDRQRLVGAPQQLDDGPPPRRVGVVDPPHACFRREGGARRPSRRADATGTGCAHSAAGRRERVRRRLERDRRGQHASQRHVGSWLDNRARRSRAGSHRSQPPGLCPHHRERAQTSPRHLSARRQRDAATVPEELVSAPCLDAGQATTLGRLMRKAEAASRHAGRNRMGARRFRLQAVAGAAVACRAGACAGRNLAEASRPQRPSGRHRLGLRPRRRGQLRVRTRRASRQATFWSRASPDPRSVTSCRASAAWWPSLAARHRISPSLARERGIPMVLGVLDATRRIPDGAQVAVDGVAGIVRWLRMTASATAHLRHPAGRQERARAPARGGDRQGQSGCEPHHCPGAR